MHTFQINVLIQFLVSSACFKHHMFIIGKTISTCSFYGMFFMHLSKQSSKWKDVLRDTHLSTCQTAYINAWKTYEKLHVLMVFLMMNIWCLKHAEDTENWIKTLIWNMCILLVTLHNCITMHSTKNIMFYDIRPEIYLQILYDTFCWQYVTCLHVVFDRFSLLKFVFLQRYITKSQQLCIFILCISAFWLCPVGM